MKICPTCGARLSGKVLWSSIFVTLVAKKDQGSYALTRAS